MHKGNPLQRSVLFLTDSFSNTLTGMMYKNISDYSGIKYDTLKYFTK